jgi:hypothetical protein
MTPMRKRRATRGVWTRRLWRRLVSRLTVLVVVCLALVLGGPADRLVPSGVDLLPLSWLHTVFAVPGAWASPTPPTPKQEQGSAAGLSDSASSAATQADGGAGQAAGEAPGQLPAYEAHGPDAASSVTPPIPTSNSFDSKRSVRVPEQARAHSDVYRNADGSYSEKVSEGPLNYQAADGSWQPIDASLTTGSDGRVHERANGVGVDFASSADDPALASIQFDAGHSVAYGLAGAAKVPASVSAGEVSGSAGGYGSGGGHVRVRVRGVVGVALAGGGLVVGVPAAAVGSDSAGRGGWGGRFRERGGQRGDHDSRWCDGGFQHRPAFGGGGVVACGVV